MSYKVAVIAFGESGFSYNALRFATSDEATAYAKNLQSRWMGMKGFEIQTSEDAVNYKFVDGQLSSL